MLMLMMMCWTSALIALCPTCIYTRGYIIHIYACMWNVVFYHSHNALSMVEWKWCFILVSGFINLLGGELSALSWIAWISISVLSNCSPNRTRYVRLCSLIIIIIIALQLHGFCCDVMFVCVCVCLVAIVLWFEMRCRDCIWCVGLLCRFWFGIKMIGWPFMGYRIIYWIMWVLDINDLIIDRMLSHSSDDVMVVYNRINVCCWCWGLVSNSLFLRIFIINNE